MQTQVGYPIGELAQSLQVLSARTSLCAAGPSLRRPSADWESVQIRTSLVRDLRQPPVEKPIWTTTRKPTKGTDTPDKRLEAMQETLVELPPADYITHIY